MKKSWILFAVFLLLSTAVFAETVPDEKAARELSDRIMSKVASGDIDAAFKIMKPYSPLRGTEIDSVALQSRSLREQYGQRYGATIGFEFVDFSKVGDSLFRLRYIEKTEKHALPWIFHFYKAPQGWVLNNFSWNDDFKKLFDNVRE